MKLVAAIALFASAASAARLENSYLPPSGAQGSGGSGSFLSAPFGGRGGSSGGGSPAPSSSYGAPSGPGRSSAPPPAILKYNNDNNGEGSYRFEYETENRISQQESGELKNPGTDYEANAVQGSYSYAGPDGATYTVNYVADENGFQAQGAHLPTPPPIPAEIQSALEQNAAEEASGCFDDGQYREEASAGQGQAAASRQYLAPNRPGFNAQTGYNY